MVPHAVPFSLDALVPPVVPKLPRCPMSSCDDLYERARNNPRGLRLVEAIQLAECYGFAHRSGGKHPNIMKRAGMMTRLNFQETGNGMAKAYQVRQLLEAIEQIGEMSD